MEATDDGADARRTAAQPQLRRERLSRGETTSPERRLDVAELRGDVQLLSSLRRDAGTERRVHGRVGRQRRLARQRTAAADVHFHHRATSLSTLPRNSAAAVFQLLPLIAMDRCRVYKAFTPASFLQFSDIWVIKYLFLQISYAPGVWWRVENRPVQS